MVVDPTDSRRCSTWSAFETDHGEHAPYGSSMRWRYVKVGRVKLLPEGPSFTDHSIIEMARKCSAAADCRKARPTGPALRRRVWGYYGSQIQLSLHAYAIIGMAGG